MSSIYFNRNKSSIFPELYDGRMIFLGSMRRNKAYIDPRDGVMKRLILFQFSAEYKDFYRTLLSDADWKDGFTQIVIPDTEYLDLNDDPAYPRKMLLCTADGSETALSLKNKNIRIQSEELYKQVKLLRTLVAILTAQSKKWATSPEQMMLDMKSIFDKMGVNQRTVVMDPNNMGGGDLTQPGMMDGGGY